MDGGEELLCIPAGEVSATDGAGEESVSRQKESVVREVEADRALRVAGRVEDGAGEAGDGDDLAIVESVVGWVDGWDGYVEPPSLNVHHFYERQVVLVVKNGGPSEPLEAVGASDVVDVGVGDDDLLDREFVFGEKSQNARDVVAWVDDDGFVGGFVAEDGAVALEDANGDDFVDHGYLWMIRVAGGC